MTPPPDDEERRKKHSTEYTLVEGNGLRAEDKILKINWKKLSIVAGTILLLMGAVGTCAGVVLPWLGVNVANIGPAAELRKTNEAIQDLQTAVAAGTVERANLRQGQDTIAKRVVAVERTMNIFGTQFCQSPQTKTQDVKEMCADFIDDLREQRRRAREERERQEREAFP